MLLDIATEELSHLEVIGSIVAMLNKGVKGELAEASQTEADLYRSLTQGGDSHTQAILYGGGAALTNSSGVPWTAAYIDTIGDPACDLRSNIAAESRAKIVYERLINITDDAGVENGIGAPSDRRGLKEDAATLFERYRLQFPLIAEILEAHRRRHRRG